MPTSEQDKMGRREHVVRIDYECHGCEQPFLCRLSEYFIVGDDPPEAELVMAEDRLPAHCPYSGKHTSWRRVHVSPTV